MPPEAYLARPRARTMTERVAIEGLNAESGGHEAGHTAAGGADDQAAGHHGPARPAPVNRHLGAAHRD